MCPDKSAGALMSAFESRLFLSSVPLKKIGADGLPQSIASGCLIDYRGKRILLTVSHATKDQGRWAIELRYEPGKGTQLYGLGAMRFLMKGSLNSSKLTDLDFSYVEVPRSIRSYRQEIIPPDTVKSETPISVHTPDFDSQPSSALKYGFCGLVKPTLEEHFGTTYLAGELKIYAGLSHLRTEGDYHVFKLPTPHEGHENFQGCSGAPVLDEAGNVVGLVCSGDKDKDEIWAFALSRYRVALDILATENGAGAT